MLHGHPLAKEMEEFWATHGGQAKDPKWQAFLDDFAKLLTSKIGEQREAHSNAGRFGMSKAGGCTRAAVLKLQHADSKPLSGSTRATFWNGHMVEVLGLATLRAIGLPVDPATEDDRQHECRIDPFMLSYTDGLIGKDARLGNEPALLSVKSAGYKMSGFNFKAQEWKRYGFAQYPMDGLKRTNPGYWAQTQAEMHAAGRKQSLLLVVAKDLIKKMEGDPYLGPDGNGSLTFYAELVQYDKAFCEKQLMPTWAATWAAHRTDNVPPSGHVLRADGTYVAISPLNDEKTNKALTGSYDSCSYCDLRDACEQQMRKTAERVA